MVQLITIRGSVVFLFFLCCRNVSVDAASEVGECFKKPLR